MPRLFTAIKIPEQITAQLMMIKGGLLGVRWVEPQDYHVTLRFFGDVDRHIATDLHLLLSGERHRPFHLEIDRLDVFGGSNPHALYANIKANRSLDELHLEQENLARRLGLKPESRKFSPHVTLARMKGIQEISIAGFLSVHGGLSLPEFKVSEFFLMSSKTSIGGGPYIIEERYRLM